MPFVLLVISAVVLSGVKVLGGMRKSRNSTLQFVTTTVVILFVMLYAGYATTSIAFMYRTPLKDDWRGVGQYLVDRVQPGDLVLVHTPPNLAFYSDKIRNAIQ